MIASPTVRYATPPQLAKLWGIKVQKVLGFIRSGQLAAVNLGDGKIKPRWKIPPSAIEAFEASRSAKPATHATRRRRKTDPSVIQFF